MLWQRSTHSPTEMTLANLLSESQIIPEMVAKERWQAIH